MNLILFEQTELGLDPEGIQASAEINLNPADNRAVHIKTILKAVAGTVIDAGIINGMQGKAEVLEISSEKIRLRFTPESAPVGLHPLTLLLGLSRPPTVKKVLKEATALGISRFILCGTENGERSYRQSSALKPEALQKILIEGVQQAHCTMLPEVEIFYDVKRAVSIIPQEAQLVALDNYEPVKTLTEYWQQIRKDNPTPDAGEQTVLAVGSERGWTDKERIVLRNAGFTLCSLGPRVLRTETASISGAALCLSGMRLI